MGCKMSNHAYLITPAKAGSILLILSKYRKLDRKEGPDPTHSNIIKLIIFTMDVVCILFIECKPSTAIIGLHSPRVDIIIDVGSSHCNAQNEHINEHITVIAQYYCFKE